MGSINRCIGFPLLMFFCLCMQNSCGIATQKKTVEAELATGTINFELSVEKLSTEVDSLINIHQRIAEASNGDTVYIPEGIYKIDHALEINHDLHLIGIGNVEIICTNMDDNVIILWSGNVSLINIKARHEPPKNSEKITCMGNVIMVDHAETIYIERCELNGCGVVGVYENIHWEKLILKDNYIHSNSSCAIYYDGRKVNEAFDCERIIFEGNTFENNGINTNELSYTEKALDNYLDYLHEYWKKVENPLEVTYKGAYFGDYFHLNFEGPEGIGYDFGNGNNNLGVYMLHDEEFEENEKYVGKRFNITWEWKLSQFLCCDGMMEGHEAKIPSIVQLELLN